MSQTPPPIDSPDDLAVSRRHEPDVVRLRWYGVAVVGLIAFLCATALMLRMFLRAVAVVPRDVDARTSVIAERQTNLDTPPLQPSWEHPRTPQEDLAELRQREDHLFAALGWQRSDPAQPHHIPDAVVARVVDAASRRPAGLPASTTRPSDGVRTTPVPGIDEGAAR